MNIRRITAVLLASVLTAATAHADSPLVDQLPVRPAASMSGYSRDEFGPPWTDNNDDALGHNGCDTRDDILARDLVDVARKGNCTVVSGVLHDPYTGRTIQFRRGRTTSVLVQIDHIVALGNAWTTGAQQLSPRQRVDLANDPRNLIAVDGAANNAKRDKDASEWLPPNRAFRCGYVLDQITVKTVYHLWITRPEKNAMTETLNHCDGK